MKKILSLSLFLLLASACALFVFHPSVKAQATVYEVGPGKPYASIGLVPWESLQAGDTVLIYWRSTPYNEKFVLCRQGTSAAPITVRGVPGANGELPILDGNGATTRPQLNYWNQNRGVIKIGGANTPPDTTPQYIVIENLDIRSARPPYTYTATNGAVQTYLNNASAIYIEKAENIIVRNCIMHDCGNGFFVASSDSLASRNILVEGCYIYDNGISGSLFEHNNYTAAIGITFQYNRFGPLRTGCPGNNFKDRSAGLVVRYNWIEGGNRQLDLVDGEDSSLIRNDPRYRETFVYGNVLIEPDAAGNRQITHYGGDSGTTANYRKGTLYFYNNTIISTRTDRTTLFRLSTNSETCDFRNNIAYVTAAGNTLALVDADGVLNLTHNWFKPGYISTFGTLTGTINNDGTSVTGSSPGFVNEAAQDYKLTALSNCINNGTTLHPNAVAANNVTRQYVKHQAGQDRVASGAFDIGAYEQAPTAISLISCKAIAYDNGVAIEWQTGYEVRNLGFNLYREANGRREAVNPQLLAGSALTTTAALSAGQAYRFLDATNTASQNAAYWLEDVDLNGQSSWHGPFYGEKATGKRPIDATDSLLLAQLNDSRTTDRTVVVQPKAELVLAKQSLFTSKADQSLASSSVNLAAQPAIKIGVRQTGWQRLTQSELVAAGLDANVDPRRLQLYIDGKELAIVVSGEADHRFDTGDALEFYGLGLDTPATNTRIYWLVVGASDGKRLSKMPLNKGARLNDSFACTVERRDRTTYFPALKNGDGDNFFGAVVTANALPQVVRLASLKATTDRQAVIEIAMQGVTEEAHQVSVRVNDALIGSLNFSGQQRGAERFIVAHSLLRDGDNLITLQSQRGASDVSLVEAIRVTYQHAFRADDDELSFTAQPGELVTINGFSGKAIRVFDVTDANAVQEVTAEVSEERTGNDFAVTVTAARIGERRLLAIGEAKTQSVVSLKQNRPSALRQTNNAADFVIIAPPALLSPLQRLAEVRQAQGLNTLLVDVEDLYDEFAFGNKTPQAIKDFLQFAAFNWQQKPRFVLLAGDASYDARNDLGFGDNDLVPTKPFATSYLKTASDDWFADFDNDGVPEMAIGRLPVRTVTAANLLINKLIAYNKAASSNEVLLVADRNDSFDFEQASRRLRSLLPPNLEARELWRSQADDATARARLLEALNRGPRLVNYTGHGSMSAWRGNLLTAADARSLTNRDKLSLFVMMTCLNGYFHDAMNETSGEALLTAERGGAIAVWASSALTLPDEQATLNQALYRLLFSNRDLTLGEAIQRAKAEISDSDVRKSWILLGDPTTKMQ